MGKHLKFISFKYLEKYSSACKINWLAVFHKLRAKSIFTADDFEYYIIASSLYSSKIEGNTIDANSFFRNRGNKSFPKKKEVQEIEDLVKAYKFASENNLNKTNFLKAHAILSKTLLAVGLRGKLRKEQVGVRDSKTLKPVYLAVEPQFVKEELGKLFADISELLQRKLSHKEVFYYASMIHLWVAKIHPFMDGNGRSARLLEKWFLVATLGMSAWSINSEKYYWDNRPEYYQNIALGYNYYVLYWDRCLPFLLMLPEALKETVE
ncbi:MAG: Fic family protein [Sphingobacteriales bacterium]|jgi:Fic family protein|nr:Fic family protein [Sphingobacteriales bacterium]MBP9142385.1 Fic family protein [Chitinophagales bacterium]MDA0198211.1 Fic family protein [Bacteroidota bacterium]MBK7526308.1 Fic family protein [Sphingobacteriales bacterium]MBK8678023.1 Fic family protein [Sphingobacteriales bacterium]